ncbi:hypothetical protein P7K49_035790 [Saguinus oedipus]|uniref:Dual serine/threonine and tyrosine protein kinase n=1 Tax=Saguinus oedipus TaxID=9490 RepID=A0ABQ9TPE8_SAGOE|nr:hypothetical protein P7K49_035790 [Saguinus oedipus]
MTPFPFQEVDIVVAPCQGLRPTVDVLGDLVNDFLPVIIYALHKDELSERDEQELQEIRKYFSFPVFFFKVPKLGSEIIDSSTRRTESERSPLYHQLIDLGYLSSSHWNCGAPGQDTKAQSMLVEQSEKLRHLSTFSHQVLQTRLVDAAKALNLVHCHCLDIFINQAFDMQRDLQITPKRLEYTRKKENELYESLMNIANRKQEEMKDMIVETLNTMKEELLDDATNMEFKDVIVPENGEPVGTREIKCCIRQIQELIISRLNQAVANKLISSVDYLRESFVGTLERCLQSLEKSQDVSVHITSNYLKQILNAAYHVEVTFHSGSSVTRMLWEQIKQIIQRITWVSPPAITLEWKRKVAQEAIESLSASKLAKSICSQFRTRLNSSHEAFAASLRQLEAGHSGRLEKTEDLWLKVRKDHAPRLARLSLESRSLQDVLLHRKPKLGQELGRGQYGVVYLCDNWGGHFPCALKSVVPPDEKHWNDLALEFHYMRSLPKHERLVDLHGSVIDYNYGGGSSIAVLLIMERLHRDLYTGLKAGMTLETRLQIALDVVEGVRFLHSQGLVHRDIKLKNVLLRKQHKIMATNYSANQYEKAFSSKYLQNWSPAKPTKECISSHEGYTQVIANDRGHLLPSVPRSKANPWGSFMGTWQMPLKIPPARVTLTSRTTAGAASLTKWIQKNPDLLKASNGLHPEILGKSHDPDSQKTFRKKFITKTVQQAPSPTVIPRSPAANLNSPDELQSSHPSAGHTPGPQSPAKS